MGYATRRPSSPFASFRPANGLPGGIEYGSPPSTLTWQQRPLKCIDVLTVSIWIPTAAAIPDAEIQHPIGTEHREAAVVIKPRPRKREYQFRGRRVGHVRVGRNRVPFDSNLRVIARVENVGETVRRELRMKRDAEETGLAAERDFVDYVDECSRQEPVHSVSLALVRSAQLRTDANRQEEMSRRPGSKSADNLLEPGDSRCRSPVAVSGWAQSPSCTRQLRALSPKRFFSWCPGCVPHSLTREARSRASA